MDITALFWYVLILVISAIPLDIAVKMLGGRSSLLKVIVANIIIAIIGYLIQYYIDFLVGFFSFIAMLFVYKRMFRMGWLRTLVAWFLQYLLISIFIVLLALIGIVIFSETSLFLV
ncbi:MAG: hypothetical protein ACOCZQ_00410 [Nanoarchaeota archaeon]